MKQNDTSSLTIADTVVSTQHVEQHTRTMYCKCMRLSLYSVCGSVLAVCRLLERVVQHAQDLLGPGAAAVHLGHPAAPHTHGHPVLGAHPSAYN